MRYKYFTLMLSFLVAFLMSTFTLATQENNQSKLQVNPLPAKDLVEFQKCGSRDVECRPVTNGCCDCANTGTHESGLSVQQGEQIAINWHALSAFREKFDCSKVSCTEMAAPCTVGQAECSEAGFCIFKPKTEFTPPINHPMR